MPEIRRAETPYGILGLSEVNPAGFDPATCGLEDRGHKDGKDLISKSLRGFDEGACTTACTSARILQFVMINWERLSNHQKRIRSEPNTELL